MSILIKGIKMPKDKDVILRIDSKGEVYIYGGYPTEIHEAVELPDHGDLIEKRQIVDALAIAEKNVSAVQRGAETEEDIRYCQGVMVGYANSILAIDNAPVVIPADRSIDKDKDVLCKSAEKSEEECEDENWYTELDDPKIAERSEE